ncbi:hypothetical protein GY45DRAFT_1439524 [Cubamyces sp. BRFM 1775]|nr:hypothetical protein GY45DRAFT_1439524 [Cubamyces sp. BRFM 1775]
MKSHQPRRPLHDRAAIVPGLYEKNLGAVDEWTLSTFLGDKLQRTLEDHCNTFIIEEDIAQLAGAGLTWIRFPIPFWLAQHFP